MRPAEQGHPRHALPQTSCQPDARHEAQCSAERGRPPGVGVELLSRHSSHGHQQQRDHNSGSMGAVASHLNLSTAAAAQRSPPASDVAPSASDHHVVVRPGWPPRAPLVLARAIIDSIYKDLSWLPLWQVPFDEEVDGGPGPAADARCS
eukprot:COSAG06_NODE_18178_length_900_cov_0.920100_2_plen_148_part_01